MQKHRKTQKSFIHFRTSITCREDKVLLNEHQLLSSLVLPFGQQNLSCDKFYNRIIKNRQFICKMISKHCGFSFWTKSHETPLLQPNQSKSNEIPIMHCISQNFMPQLCLWNIIFQTQQWNYWNKPLPKQNLYNNNI